MLTSSFTGEGGGGGGCWFLDRDRDVLCIPWMMWIRDSCEGRQLKASPCLHRLSLMPIIALLCPSAWCESALSSLDPVMVGWTPTGLSRSLQFQRLSKLPIPNLMETQVFIKQAERFNSFPQCWNKALKLKHFASVSCKVAPVTGKSPYSGLQSQPFFAVRQSSQLFMLLGCVRKIARSISVSSHTDVSPTVTFPVRGVTLIQLKYSVAIPLSDMSELESDWWYSIFGALMSSVA